MSDAALGAFLKARRAAVRPEDVGLPTHGSRRVPGLRREEVAVLASVSSDYYTRLEQGRERHPSPQVLDALARTLDLDEDARTHLFLLADLVPRRSGAAPREDVSPDLLQLLDGWTATPALVLSRTLDVLARNALARELHAGFADDDNLLRMTFLDPAGRRFYADWDRAAEASVANLRVAAGVAPDDARLRELVAELDAGSPAFRELWRRQEVRGKTREAKHFRHPDVGPLTLTYQAFTVREARDQELVVYQAEPGSASARALALLGTLAATPRAAGTV
ncbi:helix-turn-helix transcriptional regulator [Patulibacter sp. S7RM1-6]